MDLHVHQNSYKLWNEHACDITRTTAISFFFLIWIPRSWEGCVRGPCVNSCLRLKFKSRPNIEKFQKKSLFTCRCWSRGGCRVEIRGFVKWSECLSFHKKVTKVSLPFVSVHSPERVEKTAWFANRMASVIFFAARSGSDCPWLDWPNSAGRRRGPVQTTQCKTMAMCSAMTWRGLCSIQPNSYVPCDAISSFFPCLDYVSARVGVLLGWFMAKCFPSSRPCRSYPGFEELTLQ